MCGIVGYIGTKDAREIIFNGLKKLEYRGYDSAGVALLNKNKIEIYKDKGRVNHLEEITDFSFNTNFGIGHTRWATHGKPNMINSHPHFSNNKRFVVVHNGVIENYKKLKIEKLADYDFYSETDTEVIANLIEHYSSDMSTIDAIRKTASILEGSYALLVMDMMDLDTLYVAKNKTPLLIGKSEHGITVASDSMALVGYADSYMYLNDLRFAIIKKDRVILKDILGFDLDFDMQDLKLTNLDIAKGNYEHYMLKEIDEQPGVIRNLIDKYFVDEEVNIDSEILSKIRLADRIYIVACGTSLYAGTVSKYFFERLCKIPVELCIASEVAYNMPLLSKNPYFIFISQSGETADCITVLKKCKKRNLHTLAITNSLNSSIDHLADDVLHIFAGKEIAVASTKAYIAQIVVLSIIAKGVANNRKTNLKNNLSKVALAIEDVFNNKNLIKEVAKKIVNAKDAFYIGRGIDYYVCQEAALKLKEISYIHTEGYASGELKHGSIALIEEGTPVIAICTNEETNMITRSNLIETVSRGALGIVISTESLSQTSDDIVISDVASYLTPLVSIVVCQLIAYYVSVLKGNDVDKPKNLAKSVTVE